MQHEFQDQIRLQILWEMCSCSAHFPSVLFRSVLVTQRPLPIPPYAIQSRLIFRPSVPRSRPGLVLSCVLFFFLSFAPLAFVALYTCPCVVLCVTEVLLHMLPFSTI